MFSLGQWVKREVERALAEEGRDTLTLDRRISDVLGGDKSLPELMTIFQQVLLLPDRRRLRLGRCRVTDSPADEPWLVSLAAAVSAGEAVDWAAARARATADEAPVVEELHRLSQIVRSRGSDGGAEAARADGSRRRLAGRPIVAHAAGPRAARLGPLRRRPSRLGHAARSRSGGQVPAPARRRQRAVAARSPRPGAGPSPERRHRLRRRARQRPVGLVDGADRRRDAGRRRHRPRADEPARGGRHRHRRLPRRVGAARARPGPPRHQGRQRDARSRRTHRADGLQRGARHRRRRIRRPGRARRSTWRRSCWPATGRRRPATSTRSACCCSSCSPAAIPSRARRWPTSKRRTSVISASACSTRGPTCPRRWCASSSAPSPRRRTPASTRSASWSTRSARSSAPVRRPGRGWRCRAWADAVRSLLALGLGTAIAALLVGGRRAALAQRRVPAGHEPEHRRADRVRRHRRRSRSGSIRHPTTRASRPTAASSSSRRGPTARSCSTAAPSGARDDLPDRRHRRRGDAVLVGRQPLRRLPRQRHPQAGADRRRPGQQHLPDQPVRRRRVESRRRDRLLAGDVAVDGAGGRRHAAALPDPGRARPRRGRRRPRLPSRPEDLHLSHRLRRQGHGRHLSGAPRAAEQRPTLRSRPERGAGTIDRRLDQQRRPAARRRSIR